MTEQQEQYTEIEKEAQKWLDETDAMQFSQMELLTMFAAHWEVKNNDLSHNVSNRFSDEVSELNSNGLGCGLEDVGITDRYEAMEYGFEQCIERVKEVLS